ncbi:MAG: hypothetical protein AAGB48_00130 [Planctomycetota bacterium]
MQIPTSQPSRLLEPISTEQTRITRFAASAIKEALEHLFGQPPAPLRASRPIHSVDLAAISVSSLDRLGLPRNGGCELIRTLIPAKVLDQAMFLGSQDTWIDPYSVNARFTIIGFAKSWCKILVVIHSCGPPDPN